MIHVYESRSGRFQTDAPTHHSPSGEDCRLIETRETADPSVPGYTCEESKHPGHLGKTLRHGSLAHAEENPASKAKAARARAESAKAQADAASKAADDAEKAAKPK